MTYSKTPSAVSLIAMLLLATVISMSSSCSKSSAPTPQQQPSGNNPFSIPPSLPSVIDTLGVITNSSAAIKIGILGDGEEAITARGICWSTTANPTIANNKISNGTGTHAFIDTLTGLTVNTVYYVRAYATNSIGTNYSAQITFTTAFTLGQTYQGGLIYYIDATTLHGLIVTAQDLGQAPWQNATFTTYQTAGAYSTTNGDANTTLILKYFGTSGNAAAMAKFCGNGGYTDWYLPSISELNYLVGAGVKGLGGQSGTGNYWSSTENINNIADAYAVQYQFNETFTDLKNTVYLVRAIRAF